MIIYQCQSCGQESGYTESDKPRCRYCNAQESLTMVSKQILTPELLSDRLKSLSDNMMKNLESALHFLPELDNDAFGPDKDAEMEMLTLLARVQKFRDTIHNLELHNPDEEKSLPSQEKEIGL